MDTVWKNAIVKYENTSKIDPINKRKKLLRGNASVKTNWLKIVEIANKPKVILIKVGKFSR